MRDVRNRPRQDTKNSRRMRSTAIGLVVDIESFYIVALKGHVSFLKMSRRSYKNTTSKKTPQRFYVGDVRRFWIWLTASEAVGDRCCRDVLSLCRESKWIIMQVLCGGSRVLIVFQKHSAVEIMYSILSGFYEKFSIILILNLYLNRYSLDFDTCRAVSPSFSICTFFAKFQLVGSIELWPLG